MRGESPSHGLRCFRLAVLLLIALIPLSAPARAQALATADRLASPLVISGGMRFDVPAASVFPHRSAATVRIIAARIAIVGRSVPVVAFARYTSSPGRLGEDGRLTSRIAGRAVWLVRYRSVPRLRATAIPARQAHPPSTTSREVLVDLLVVIDDATGDVLLRSELPAAPS